MRSLSFAWIGALLAACATSVTPVGPFGVGDGTDGDGGTPSTEEDGGTTTQDGSTPKDSGLPGKDGGSTPQDDGAVDPVDAAEYNTPTVCTSGKFWTGGDTKSADMHPGVACNSCHVVGGKAGSKTFDVGGTVYPTAHEPDDCNGVAGATVVITDANGNAHNLSVTGVGNFYNQDFFGFTAIPKPYHAKVVFNGKEREMVAAQTDGDCNKCHSVTGTSNAPGRIMLP